MKVTGVMIFLLTESHCSPEWQELPELGTFVILRIIHLLET